MDKKLSRVSKVRILKMADRCIASTLARAPRWTLGPFCKSSPVSSPERGRTDPRVTGIFHDHAERAGVHPACFPSPGDVGLRPYVAQRMLEYLCRRCILLNQGIRAHVAKASIGVYCAIVESGGPIREDEQQADISDTL